MYKLSQLNYVCTIYEKQIKLTKNFKKSVKED